MDGWTRPPYPAAPWKGEASIKLPRFVSTGTRSGCRSRVDVNALMAKQTPRAGRVARMPRLRWGLGCLLASGLAFGMHSAPVRGDAMAEAPAGVVTQERYEPVLVPKTTAGMVGWGVFYNGFAGRNYQELRPESGQWLLAARQRRARVKPPYAAIGFLITSSRVAAVSIDGSPPLSTSPEPGLPFGLRILAYEIPLASAEQARRYVKEGWGSRLGLSRVLVAYDAQGQQLAEPVGERMDEPLETRSWEHPANRGSGACRIAARHLGSLSPRVGTGLTPLSGSVVLGLRPTLDLSGRPFLSCANTTFQFGTRRLIAAVLVDARHPGGRPAPIPETHRARGRPGVVRSIAPHVELVARRLPRGWLVVEGGSSLDERLIVLQHLAATIG